jgi:predicted ATP-binding protein involved in virulence
VLFAGAGLSKRAGFPTWSDFVTGLLDWATEMKFVDEAWARSRRASIERGDGGAVADGIVDALQDQARNQALLNHYLLKIFTEPAKLSTAHTKLRNIKFCAALTTNFDNLLEQTFEKQNPRMYTPTDAEQLIEVLHKREFFILKLYGDLGRTETLMISPTQFEDAIGENLPFSKFIETLFLSKTLLFIGASLEGIEDYLKGVGLKRQKTPREHWALVGVSDKDSWLAKAESLKKRYGIGIIPYRINPKHTAVVDFLRKLERRVAAQGGVDVDKDSVTQLSKIQLENIGPFESLDLKLDPSWNILLGDNGVGKSNILRAIAVAICGKDAQPYAGRLIRTDSTSASIILETDRGNTYKTELLKMTSGPAQMETIPVRPLEAEGWLAIGFPALRTVSWERPKAPEQIAKSIPTADDLLPLVRGEPDPRLDKLKQWIVNLDYLSKHEQSKTGAGGSYEKLLNKFFEYVSVLTGDVTIERGEVNPHTYEITVITDDGPLPIEAISQGMTSLIGWVGILLQRLYEIYSDDEDPTQRFALILMDEIDAHLHPGWQQSLVSNLSKIFPNAQFIATTHSPLIIGGMPPEQVIRLGRDDEGKVGQLTVEQDMTVGRADQILTSELFGLKTTLALDGDTQEDLNNYKRLLGKTKRTTKEEKKFQELRRRLHSSMPMSGETRAEREEQSREREDLLREVRTDLSETSTAGDSALTDRALTEEEHRRHNDARRFARLLVSELKLYNERKVKDGLNEGDIYGRLRDEIDRSRQMYDKRVAPQVTAKNDYFQEELIETVAKGDPSKLGPHYPLNRAKN